MKKKEEKLDSVMFVRMTKEMKKKVHKTAKEEKIYPTHLARRALMFEVGITRPLDCACGKHWGHVGKHYGKRNTAY
jgi:hypothetical protein